VLIDTAYKQRNYHMLAHAYTHVTLSYTLHKYTAQTPKQVTSDWIECCAYSPDGLTLAIAGHDKLIHLLTAGGGYSRRAVCRGHASYITHIDFSSDSKHLQR
jgi:WD40 repeat protein